MSKSNNGVAPDPVPPLPPRWKGVRSLDLVHQLNERCIELLCDMAVDTVRHTALPIVTENRDLWVRLEGEARQRAAWMPFVIVDAQFKNEAWWRRVAEFRAGEAEAEEASNGLPHEPSEHLMQETTMFAWQTARWDRTVAQMSLGMSPSVAEVIAALTPQQVREIAARESQGIRVRWADDPRFWRDLLVAAKDGNDERLAELHSMPNSCSAGELAQLHR